MGKIKINTNRFRNPKLTLIASILGAAIVFNGCSTFNKKTNTIDFKNKNDNHKNDYSQSQIYNENTTILDSSVPMNDVSNKEKTNTLLNFTNDNNIFVQEYINNYDVYYEYSNLYNFEGSLKEYNKLYISNSHDIKLKNITGEEIYNQVVKNNTKYKETKKTSVYKLLESSDLKKICNLIADTINDFLRQNKNISEERVKCILSDLKIFNQMSSVSNAFVTNDNCFIISPNMLKIAQMINGKGTESDIFIHEVVHLLQKGCNCDLQKNENLERNYGFGYKFKNLEINSLDFTWLCEASAEKCMINYTGSNALVYKNMIGYLESLSIVNVLNDSYKVNDTEKLTFNKEIEKLYEFFSATTEKEKKEVLNLIYSIQIMQGKPDDFYDLYAKEKSLTVDSKVVDDVNYTLKPSICLTLSKYFYKNLSQNIANKTITVEDIFYLISLFENDLNNHILYNENKFLEYNKSFIDSYIEIQSVFFNEVSKSLGWNIEDLMGQFLNYSALIKTNNGVVNNCNLDFISNDKKNYLKERQDALKTEAAPSIYSVYLSLINKKIIN